MYIAFSYSGSMNEQVVLYFEPPDTVSFPATPVAQVDFLWFPTANLFEAFTTNFIADQNSMRCFGVELTPYFRDETVGCLSFWNINLKLKSSID